MAGHCQCKDEAFAFCFASLCQFHYLLEGIQAGYLQIVFISKDAADLVQSYQCSEQGKLGGLLYREVKTKSMYLHHI